MGFEIQGLLVKRCRVEGLGVRGSLVYGKPFGFQISGFKVLGLGVCKAWRFRARISKRSPNYPQNQLMMTLELS